MVSRWIALALIAALPLFAWQPSARAATVIYYSAPGNAYGWCAGFASGRSHGCARGYCVDSGGTACGPVLECGGGWGAVALAQDPARGFGASCGLSNAAFARAVALAACMGASNGLCWTDSTFTGRGESLSADSNRAFDHAYLAQAMLQIRHYDPGSADGELGASTRSAIGALQSDLGRTATGILDDELFDRLLDAVGGAEALAAILKRDVLVPRESDLAGYLYREAPSPAPQMSFSAELMNRTEDARRLALAVILSTSGTKCSLPARSASLVFDADSGMWNVECVEGAYTLILTESGRTIIRNGDGK